MLRQHNEFHPTALPKITGYNPFSYHIDRLYEDNRVRGVNALQDVMEPRRPIIGIVPGLVPCDTDLRVAEQYEDAINLAGGAPLVLPILKDTAPYRSILPLIDGFVLSGGNDVDPSQYGKGDGLGKVGELTPQRDSVERLILAYVYANDIPVLGICRGFQMINVFFGGTLYLDLDDRRLIPGRLPGDLGIEVQHRQTCLYSQPSHWVEIIKGTHLETLLGRRCLRVNSMHHQGIERLATVLRATAISPDGLVEGIEMPSRSFIMGVQWHPEYFPAPDQMGGIFTGLVDEAKRAHESADRAGAELSLDLGSIEHLRGCLNMNLGDPLSSAAL